MYVAYCCNNYRPSVRPSVRLPVPPSVRPFVRPSIYPSKLINRLNDLLRMTCSTIVIRKFSQCTKQVKTDALLWYSSCQLKKFFKLYKHRNTSYSWCNLLGHYKIPAAKTSRISDATRNNLSTMTGGLL